MNSTSPMGRVNIISDNIKLKLWENEKPSLRITIIPLILVAFILTPIKLVLLSRYLDGFMINGFWVYLALTAILSIFTIGSSSSSKE